MCALLQIPDLDHFHNAGNDAHVCPFISSGSVYSLSDVQFTLLGLKAMASGDPLDKQRSTRWPGQDSEINPGGGKTVSVEWKPYQLEDDYDDMEGIFPPAKGAEYHSDGEDDPKESSWVS